jgi:formate/nitrite transporter FocA (FNT family)
LSLLGGIYLSLGVVLSISIGGQLNEMQEIDPGLQKLILGVFGIPFGLTMVVLCGADLMTIN